MSMTVDGTNFKMEPQGLRALAQLSPYLHGRVAQKGTKFHRQAVVLGHVTGPPVDCIIPTVCLNNEIYEATISNQYIIETTTSKDTVFSWQIKQNLLTAAASFPDYFFQDLTSNVWWCLMHKMIPGKVSLCATTDLCICPCSWWPRLPPRPGPSHPQHQTSTSSSCLELGPHHVIKRKWCLESIQDQWCVLYWCLLLFDIISGYQVSSTIKSKHLVTCLLKLQYMAVELFSDPGFWYARSAPGPSKHLKYCLVS